MYGAEWLGFYGPSYRELLHASDGRCSWSEAWSKAVVLHESNPTNEGHWEFLAVAYLHLIDSLGPLTSLALRHLQSIRGRFQRQPTTVNWKLMARCVDVRLKGRRLTHDDVRAVGITQVEDGGLPDEPGEVSSQYHAYILLLILRFGDRADLQLRRIVEAAFRWMEAVDRDCGDPSPLGRGRFQLFGYGAMSAAGALAVKWDTRVSADWFERVKRRCRAEAPGGSMSNVWTGPSNELLLHGYNTLVDYPMFAQLWTNGIAECETLTERSRPSPAEGWWWHALDDIGSGILADRDGPRMAVLYSPEAAVLGRRKLLGKMIRSLLRPAHARRADECTFLSSSGTIGAFEFDLSGKELRCRVAPVELTTRQLLSGVDVWFPSRTNVEVSHGGSVELEALTWRRPGGQEWAGYSIRVVRRGELELVCRPL